MTRASEWAERVTAWRKSGQTADEFARGKDFRAKTLQWWASELVRRGVLAKSKRRGRGGGSVRFARVVRKRATDISSLTNEAAEGASTGLVVRVGRAEISVGRGFDASLFAEVVDALGGAR